MSHYIVNVQNGRLGNYHEKQIFIFYMALLPWFETSPTLPMNQCTYRDLTFKRRVHPIKKYVVPFWCCKSVEHWNTASPCNLELRIATVLLVKIVYNQRMIVQKFCFRKRIVKTQRRGSSVVGLFDNSQTQIWWQITRYCFINLKSNIMFVYAVQFKLLSNLSSFQRQWEKLQCCLGVLFQPQIIFPIGKLTIFILEKNGLFEDESLNLFSQFILVMCSYILIKYFIHFIAPTLLFLHLR